MDAIRLIDVFSTFMSLLLGFDLIHLLCWPTSEVILSLDL